MKDWFDKMFFSSEPLGDKILNILIGIFAILFIGGWVLLILFVLVEFILRIIKWINSKLSNQPYDFEQKLDSFSDGMWDIFKIPSKLFPASIDSLIFRHKDNIQLFKTISIGILIPTIAIIIWLFSSFSPVNDFMFITNSKLTKGYIFKAEQHYEEVSSNDGSDFKEIDYYTFKYDFSLSSNKKIIGSGKDYGAIPEYLVNLDSNPYEVNIKYLLNNPKVSRVSGTDNYDNTIWEWFRHEVFTGLMIILFLIYYGFAIIKEGVDNYKYKIKKFKEYEEEENS